TLTLKVPRSRLWSEGGSLVVGVPRAPRLGWPRQFGAHSAESRDKLAAARWRPARSGAPILQDGLAYFDCDITAKMRTGDHELVIGRVVDGRILDASASPLIYQATGDMDDSAALYPAAF